MPDPISSLQNPRIKQVIRLRDASGRRDTGLMVIDGAKEIRQAVLGNVEFTELFVDSRCTSIVQELGLAKNSLTSAQLERLEEAVTPVSSQVLEKIAFGNRNESVVAVAKQPSIDLTRLTAREPGLILVIDQVEKPGNLGAMLRTADGVGASAVLLSDPVCDVWNPNAIRASLGAIFRLPIAVGSALSVLRWLNDSNFQVVAARVDGSLHYRNLPWSSKVAIVVGSEANGLGDEWNHPTVVAVKLPMRGTVDSLNVSVTAAVLLYEAASREML
jgi:TrmH family RNA methyltransferase